MWNKKQNKNNMTQHQNILEQALKLVTQEQIDKYVERGDLVEISKLEPSVAWVCFKTLHDFDRLRLPGFPRRIYPNSFPKVYEDWFKEKGQFLFLHNETNYKL